MARQKRAVEFRTFKSVCDWKAAYIGNPKGHTCLKTLCLCKAECCPIWKRLQKVHVSQLKKKRGAKTVTWRHYSVHHA